MIVIFPIEIWQYMYEFMDLLSIIRVRQTCKVLYRKTFVCDLLNIDYRYKAKLNDDVVKNYKGVKYLYGNHVTQNIIDEMDLIELDAWGNSKINNVNHMKRLNVLNAGGVCCNIDHKGIENVNLIVLNASHNTKINSVNHMKRLIKLDACLECGIDQKGIEGVNLVELNAWGNSNITNVNHMDKIVILDASGGCCGIDQKGIEKVNLIKLNVSYNRKVTNVNHMNKLTMLYASGDSGIDQKGIDKLDKLIAHIGNKIINKNIN